MKITSHNLTLLTDNHKQINLSKQNDGDVTINVGDSNSGYQQAESIRFNRDQAEKFIHLLQEMLK